MNINNSSTAVNLEDYGIDHVSYDCCVSFKQLEATISELRHCLTPYQPNKLIYLCDSLYYQLIDHSTDQEITMLESGYPDYMENRAQHTLLFETLTSCSHKHVVSQPEAGEALINQIESWANAHRDNETAYSHYQESLRFKSTR